MDNLDYIPVSQVTIEKTRQLKFKSMGLPVDPEKQAQELQRNIKPTQLINKGLMIMTVIITLFSFFILLFSSAISQYYKDKYVIKAPEEVRQKIITVEE